MVADDAGGSTVPDSAAGIDAEHGIDGAGGVDGASLHDGAADPIGTGIDQAASGSDGQAPDAGGGDKASVADVPDDMVNSQPDAPMIDAPLDAPIAEDSGVDSNVVDAPSVDAPPLDAPPLANGAICQSGHECSSTYCVDGVCCDGACTGQCQACAETTSVGTCTTVLGSPRGTRAACAASRSTCAGSCAGSAYQCSYPGSGVICSSAICSNDTTVKTASVCNGAGACTSSSMVACTSGQYCASGACNTQSANGAACQGNAQCTSGNCSNSLCCSSGYGHCSGSSGCVSLTTSTNCGTCGNACGSGYHCSGGTCAVNCYYFYKDADGDGYGDPNTYTSQCGSSTPPPGYVSNSEDCCDNDPSAKPGQTGYFTTADACSSFDYNCDGSETPNPGCTGTPTCVLTTVSGNPFCQGDCISYSSGTCGENVSFGGQACKYDGVSACGTYDTHGNAATLPCH